jgi:hypothetical protein
VNFGSFEALSPVLSSSAPSYVRSTGSLKLRTRPSPGRGPFVNASDGVIALLFVNRGGVGECLNAACAREGGDGLAACMNKGGGGVAACAKECGGGVAACAKECGGGDATWTWAGGGGVALSAEGGGKFRGKFEARPVAIPSLCIL